MVFLTLSLLVMIGGLVAVLVGILRPPTPARQVLLFAAVAIAHLGTGLLLAQVLPYGTVSNIAVAIVLGGALMFSVGAVRSYAALRRRVV